MRSKFKFVALSSPIVLMVVIAIFMTRDIQRQRHAAAENLPGGAQWKAMRKGCEICFNILDQYERWPGATFPVRSFEDSLKWKLITTEEYQFLANHGAIFHPLSWDATPSDTVVMELFGGDYLISKNKRGWPRDPKAIQHAAKKG